MTPKEYLSQYRDRYGSFESRMEELKERKDALQKLTTSYSDMPKNHNGGVDWTEQLNAIVDEERELQQKYEDAMALRREIISVIEDTHPCQCAELLRLKYINGYTLLQIAERMHLSYDWTRHFHGICLQNVRIPKRRHITTHFPCYNG